jgi:cadmium resistance protein CadD (predicted permease)
MPAGLLADLGLAATAFVGTNSDNAVVTVAMVAAAPPERAHRIVTGQLFGFALLTAVAAGTAAVLFELSTRTIGLLGIVPLLMGGHGVVNLVRHRQRADPARRAVGSGFVAAALITVGAGGDNLAAYIPLFRAGGIVRPVAVLGVFVVGEVLLTLLVLWLGRHPRTQVAVARVNVVATPLLYCAIGVLIMLWAGTI